MFKAIMTRAPINNPSFDGIVKINNLNYSGIVHTNNDGSLTSEIDDISYTTSYDDISLSNIALSWTDMTVSSNGQIILAIASNNYLHISRDSGNTWKPTLKTITKSWYSCAMTKNGNVMIVGTSNEYLYISKDSGITWNVLFTDSTKQWNNIAISDDALYILAITSSEIYISSDGGNTWTTLPGYSSLLRCVMSANGKIQVIVKNANSNQVYISIDYGINWTNKTIIDAISSLINIVSIAITNDGNIIRILDNYGNIHTTTDNFNSTTTVTLFITDDTRNIFLKTITMDGTGNKIFVYSPLLTHISLDGGITFNTKSLDKKLSIMRLSNDGLSLYLTDLNKSIYKSIDNLENIIGNNHDIFLNFSTVAMSSDGNIIVTAGNNTYIYVSTDGGITWKEKYLQKNWKKIIMSSNGQYMVAISTNTDNIYISSDYGNTWTNKGESLTYI